MDVIAKKDLIDGHYYLNKNDGRGMRIGMWNGYKGANKFMCWKPEWGWRTYEMEHVEDDRGFTVFEPIIDITEQFKHINPVEPEAFKKKEE